jgi:DNA-binding MarR family transcriptional regulator
MNETKKTIIGQLARLETLTHRYQLSIFKGGRSGKNPHRGQGRVLSILKMQPEISQKELGYLLDMSKQALAELLGKLEKRGYITRVQSETDRRAYIIKLTEEGRKALPGAAEAGEADENHDAGAGFNCLSDEEQRSLSDYLGRMIAELEEKLGDTGDESDFAEYFREQFFANHGFGGHVRGTAEHMRQGVQGVFYAHHGANDPRQGFDAFRRGGFGGRKNDKE